MNKKQIIGSDSCKQAWVKPVFERQSLKEALDGRSGSGDGENGGYS